MTTFALLHGAGDGGWAWHLVGRALVSRGHRAVAPDLPTDRADATWHHCVDVVEAALDRTEGLDDLVVVGHSAGGFVVPLVAERLAGRREVRLQVFVAGMVPRPGESAAEWFGAVGWTGGVPDLDDDVPPGLAAEAAARERSTSDRLGAAPWPAAALPAVPSRYVVTTRDRFLPPAVQRRVAAERLGITAPDEVATGHCPHLSRPEELADLLAGDSP
ncbi:alpha/beta fold hydrolase [Nocardioides sp. Arc9.136]|uniref:alpha/beta fold hydrolase n=1 Tax=Nocardioides sp. Arc9.136 TaxID=2996826 RepID=UPI002666E1CE|nr:alpha/beta hydrolase [Nocardioides sp. Arc9.136]WKN47994.1 alpha/beta hydrolase [Nocardioides sp. Arc9.136]